MRKVKILIIILSLFLLNSCYDENRDATVRINLGNMPLAKINTKESMFDKLFSLFVKSAYAQTLPQDIGVIRVHLAALDGNKLLTKVALDTAGMTSNIVEFSVPAGKNITILVVGENSSNEAGFYGYNEVDLSPAETSDVTITVNSAVWSWGSSITSTYMPIHMVMWDPSGVPTKYVLIDDSTDNLLYEGYGTEADVTSGSSVYRFYVDFWMFDLKTAEVVFSDV